MASKEKEELRETRKQWLPTVTTFSPRDSLSLAERRDDRDLK